MPGINAPINVKLEQVPTVEIAESGIFKYILCKIYEGNSTHDSKLIVRGSADAMFHVDIYDTLDARLEAGGIVCECTGGGIIKHNSAERSIHIYGESLAYGKANHATTASLLQKSYAAYCVTWTD